MNPRGNGSLIRNFYSALIGELDNPANHTINDCVDQALNRILDVDSEACPTCRGRGTVTVDWGEMTCPRCRLDREERAAEEWKALRDSGADELTLRAMAGDK